MKKQLSIFALLLSVFSIAAFLSGCKSTEAEYCAPAAQAVTAQTILNTNEVHVGKQFTYKIVVTNPIQECGVANVVVEQHLSDNFRLISSVPEATMMPNNVARWELGTMASNETRTITITGVAKSPGNVVNCTTVDYNKKVCVTISAISPKLEVTKKMPSSALCCKVVPVELTVSNVGTGTAKNIKLTDYLPRGIEIDGKQTLAWDVPDLEQGDSYTVSYNFIPGKTGVFTNKAVVVADNDLTDSTTATMKVVEPVLKIRVDGPSQIYSGRNATYDIFVENSGSAPADNLVVKADLPSNASYVASDGTKEAGTVMWQLPPLGIDKVAVMELTLKGDTIGTIKNMVNASADCAVASGSASTEVIGIPAILLEVVDVTDPVEVGNTTTYIITATNQGSATATNIAITCNKEENVQYVSTQGPTKASVFGDELRFAPLAELQPKEATSWRVNVKAVSPGDVRFKTMMTSDQLQRPVVETEATNIY